MKGRIGIIVALLSTLSMSTAPMSTTAWAATGTTDQAVAYELNVGHSGALSNDTLTPALVQAWTRNLGGSVSYPLIAGGRVFVTVGNPSSGSTPNYGSTIYAIDETRNHALERCALRYVLLVSCCVRERTDLCRQRRWPAQSPRRGHRKSVLVCSDARPVQFQFSAHRHKWRGLSRRSRERRDALCRGRIERHFSLDVQCDEWR